MTRKPRRDVIVRRFLDGMAIVDLLVAYLHTPLCREDVEDAIRWAFERRCK